MRNLIITITLLFCCATAFAQQSSYKTIRDISYRTNHIDAYADSMRTIDLYYPLDTKGFATVIWFHGGGLTSGRKEIPQELTNKGLAVVGVDYRLAPKATVEDCISDAAEAAAWVVNHIGEYGGDTDLIFVAGHSAGGYLTSMIGLDKKWMERYGINPDKAFAALIPYSGQVITHFTRRSEMGMKESQPLVDDLAPLYHVRPDCPPILILSGDRELEMLGRYEENAYFWRMMQVVGHPNVKMREFDGFDHGNMPQAGHFVAVRYIKDIIKGKKAAKKGD